MDWEREGVFLSGGTNALVGVAISASLLPPVVNSGMCVSFALLGQVGHTERNIISLSFPFPFPRLTTIICQDRLGTLP